MTISSPNETAQQVCARDATGAGFLLSVIAKRTYTVAPGGECVVAEKQLPLSLAITTAPADPNLVLADIDVLPSKPRTDVVVRGHAYGDGSNRGLELILRIGRAEKRVLVIGPRNVALSATGGLVLSAAAPFEKIPLSFSHAYGGRDRGAEARHGNPFAAMAPHLAGTGLVADNLSPYIYPRNPSGKGYLIEATAAAVEQCELPNLEDPLDPLTPERLLVGHHERWIYQPMPQGLDWMGWGWFPRAAFGGIKQDFVEEATAIPEVARGLVPGDILGPAAVATAGQTLRFANGAPIDLQLPHLNGDEKLEISHAHPGGGTWRARLPGRPPRISIDGRDGKLIATTPVLQTVLIEPDESRISLVYRGSGPAKRPYFPAELSTMPLLVEW